MTTILVIDDDQVMLDLLRTVLTDEGYDTLVAPSLDAIPVDATADVVITDLVPVKAYQRQTALDWVSSLRRRFADSPVMIVTAHAEAAAEADMLGANAIIVKPFDVELLLATLDDLVTS
jgi:DNA-binding response OmpR family regulator